GDGAFGEGGGDGEAVAAAPFDGREGERSKTEEGAAEEAGDGEAAGAIDLFGVLAEEPILLGFHFRDDGADAVEQFLAGGDGCGGEGGFQGLFAASGDAFVEQSDRGVGEAL